MIVRSNGPNFVRKSEELCKTERASGILGAFGYHKIFALVLKEFHLTMRSVGMQSPQQSIAGPCTESCDDSFDLLTAKAF